MRIDKHVYFKNGLRICKTGAYKYFGVRRNSYASSIIERLYDYYCRGSVNLYWQYLKYYRREFNDFRDFLDKKHNLFPNEITSLNSVLLKHKNLDFQPSGSIGNLIDRGEENSVEDIFDSFLEGK